MGSATLVRVVALAAVVGMAAAWAQTAPARKPQSPAEAAALQSLGKQFNDPNTTATLMDAAINDFRQQYPNSQYTLPVLLLGVRYHRAHDEYLELLRYGMAVLELEPRNLYTLSTLGQAIPENVRDSDLDRDQRLDQAADFDRQVIGVTESFLITSTGLDLNGTHYTQAQAQTLRNNLAGPAYLSLGRVAMLRQQFPQAIEAYQEALRFEPAPADQAQTYYDIGAAAVGAHEVAEAQTALGKAKSLSGNSPFLQHMIQDELDKLGGG